MRGWLIAIFMLVSNSVFAFKMEAGSVTLNDTFVIAAYTNVTLQQTYDAPPLVFLLPTQEGGDPSDLRIRNVTATGFQVAAVEPPGNDGQHVPMTLDYIAIEAGVHLLPDGTRIEANSFNTQTLQRQSNVGGPQGWDGVTFSASFAAQATVLAQIQTMDNEEAGDLLNPATPQGPSRPWLSIAVNSVTTSGFDAALERAEVDVGSVTVDEEFGWMAIQSGRSGSFVDTSNTNIQFDSFNTNDVIDGWDDGCDNVGFPTINSANRIAVASKIKRDGSDGGWVRRCAFANNSIGLTIDEDINRDTERNHTTEVVSVLVFDQAFIYDSENEPDILFMKLLDAVISDPVNGTNAPKAIPDAIVQYRLNASNHGNGIAENVVLADSVPTNTALFVGDLSAVNSGPMIFTQGSPASGLTYTYSMTTPTIDSLEFSMDGGVNWNYQPTADADGFDALVTHFRIVFSGDFEAEMGLGAPNFDLRFRVRVN